jgi:hypothetical protein
MLALLGFRRRADVSRTHIERSNPHAGWTEDRGLAIGSREFVLEVDAEALEKIRKVAHVKIPLIGESFTIACAEGEAP